MRSALVGLALALSSPAAAQDIAWDALPYEEEIVGPGRQRAPPDRGPASVGRQPARDPSTGAAGAPRRSGGPTGRAAGAPARGTGPRVDRGVRGRPRRCAERGARARRGGGRGVHRGASRASADRGPPHRRRHLPGWSGRAGARGPGPARRRRRVRARRHVAAWSVASSDTDGPAAGVGLARGARSLRAAAEDRGRVRGVSAARVRGRAGGRRATGPPLRRPRPGRAARGARAVRGRERP